MASRVREAILPTGNRTKTWPTTSLHPLILSRNNSPWPYHWGSLPVQGHRWENLPPLSPNAHVHISVFPIRMRHWLGLHLIHIHTKTICLLLWKLESMQHRACKRATDLSDFRGIFTCYKAGGCSNPGRLKIRIRRKDDTLFTAIFKHWKKQGINPLQTLKAIKQTPIVMLSIKNTGVKYYPKVYNSNVHIRPWAAAFPDLWSIWRKIYRKYNIFLLRTI